MNTATHALLPQVIAISREAGAAIMRVYSGDIQVRNKTDGSPLTQADMAAHRIIVTALARLQPSLPVLSEESEALPFATRAQWGEYWLVDPLDGTREFIKRNGEFTVNIALIRQGRPALGVVYAPAPGLLYFADQAGAFKQDGDGDLRPIHAREPDLGSLVIAASRSHGNERLQRFVANIESRCAPVAQIARGSSLKICLVAEGSADLYARLGPTSEWDTAAAQCVLERAGGRLLATSGQPLRYNGKASLLNPEFFACGAGTHDWRQYLPME